MEDEEELSLVKKVPEKTSTDVIMELKVGIYNLFIGLVNNLTLQFGPEVAIESATDFLNEIIVNFKSAIETDQE